MPELATQSSATHPKSDREAARAGSTARVRQANDDDSEFLAWAILTASRSHGKPGVFDLALETEEDRRDVAEWLALSDVPNFCRPEHFFIREQDGHPVAALCGYDGADPNMGSLAPAMADAFDGLEFDADEYARALDRLSAFQACAPPVGQGYWVVEWVATKRAARQQGHAKALLRAVLDEGRSRGHRYAQVSTTIDNAPAIRLYEAVGFQIADELRSERFQELLDSPGMVRLVRAL